MPLLTLLTLTQIPPDALTSHYDTSNTSNSGVFDGRVRADELVWAAVALSAAPTAWCFADGPGWSSWGWGAAVIEPGMIRSRRFSAPWNGSYWIVTSLRMGSSASNFATLARGHRCAFIAMLMSRILKGFM